MRWLKAITCLLIGHSKIQNVFFCSFYCGRCGKLLGDWLGDWRDDIASTPDIVIVGDSCKACYDNYKKCTWKDKLFVGYPFKQEEDETVKMFEKCLGKDTK